MTTQNVTKPLTIAALVCMMAVGALTGCEREGPAERTGEAIDDAARSTQEHMEEAGDNIRDCVDDPDGC